MTYGGIVQPFAPKGVRNAAGGVRRGRFACGLLIAPHRSGICARRRATRRLYDLRPASAATNPTTLLTSLAAGAGFSTSTLGGEVRRKRERTIGARAQNPLPVPARGAGVILLNHANSPRAQKADAPFAYLLTMRRPLGRKSADFSRRVER